MEKDYKEIELREAMRVILKRWWIILLTFIICVGISVVISYYFINPVYNAQTSLFVGKEKSKKNITGIDYNELKINDQLINDYRELAKSRVVVKKVIDNFKLDMSIKTFQNNIVINSVKDTRVFIIGFQYKNPQMATDIVNELAQVFINKAVEIVNVENIQVIDVAEVPNEPIKPNKKLNIAIASVLGIMLGIFIIFLIEYFDNTIKIPNDIEKNLGFNIMGAIPVFKGDEKSV